MSRFHSGTAIIGASTHDSFRFLEISGRRRQRTLFDVYVQLKATSQQVQSSNAKIPFDLEVGQYNKLRIETSGNAWLLVLLVLPPSVGDWLKCSPRGLTLKTLRLLGQSVRGAHNRESGHTADSIPEEEPFHRRGLAGIAAPFRPGGVGAVCGLFSPSNRLSEKLVAGLDPVRLQRYVRDTGWKLEPRLGRGLTAVFERPESRLMQISIPLTRDLSDFAVLMSDVVAVLATREQRPALDVLRELLLPPGDIILQFAEDGACLQRRQHPVRPRSETPGGHP